MILDLVWLLEHFVPPKFFKFLDCRFPNLIIPNIDSYLIIATKYNNTDLNHHILHIKLSHDASNSRL